MDSTGCCRFAGLWVQALSICACALALVELASSRAFAGRAALTFVVLNNGRGPVRMQWRDQFMRGILVLLVAVLVLPGAANAGAPSGDEVAFEEVFSGSFSIFSYDGPLDLVIRNKRQWCKFWDHAHGTRTDPPACDLSLVDFRHEVVIASALVGSNGCVGIDITHIEARSGRGALRVFTRDTVPGRNCICTQAFVFPVQAVVVSKSVGRVRFIHQAATLHCE